MQRIEAHIKTIVGRYKGRIHSYDIVNEVFGHEDWDTRELTAICGIGFVPLVYKWAHEADPDAILILNDNYHDIPKKRNNIFKYVKQWIAEGAPIHGVGFQDHLFIDTDLDAVEETLKLFSTIPDFKIYITELDINAYRFEDYSNRYPDYMTDEILELMAKKYTSLFDVYRKYSKNIETIGFWNVCDARTWLDEFYVPGRKHYALPFGYDGEPRDSFYGIVDLEKKRPRWERDTKIPEIRMNNYKIEDDTLTVYGVDNHEKFGTVKVELFADFEKETLVYTETKEIEGGYKFSFKIDTEELYSGQTSPDYVLKVTESDGTVKTDKFTYYTKNQREKYYTVTDKLDNFLKTYNTKNCVIKTMDGKKVHFRSGSGVTAFSDRGK